MLVIEKHILLLTYKSTAKWQILILIPKSVIATLVVTHYYLYAKKLKLQ